jgi:hypothetical protein
VLKLTGSAVAGCAAVALAGCGRKSSPTVSKVPAASRHPDVLLLNRVLDIEHVAIAAYTAGIPLLPGLIQKAAQQFLAQEVSHAGELGGLVRQAGGKAHLPQASYDLGHPRNSGDVLALLHALERMQIAAYIAVIPKLSPGSVRSAVSTLLANDAQHVSILRAAVGRDPVPAALVTGTE